MNELQPANANFSEAILDGDVESAYYRPTKDGWILTCKGWLLINALNPSKLEAGVQGAEIQRVEPIARPDLVQAFPKYPQAENSGFELQFFLRARLKPPFEVFVLLTMEDGRVLAAALPAPARVPTLQLEGSESGQVVPQLTEIELVEAYEATQQQQCAQFLSSTTASLCFPQFSQPQVSIVIVVHNQAHRTLACLRSLARSKGPACEIVIVDNASTDTTSRVLEKVQGITILKNEQNLHFLLGANQGANVAKGKYLLFLNNDTEVLSESIAHALECIEHEPNVGAVGGRLIHPSGVLQEAGCGLTADGQAFGYGRGWSPSTSKVLYRREVTFVSGAFLLTPTVVFRTLGGFDQRFAPAYFEDADYCLRLKQHQLRTMYEPRATVLHAEFGSAVQAADVETLQARGGAIFREIHKDGLTLGRINHSRPAVLVIDDVVPSRRRGAGSPRMLEIVRAMDALGYQVKFFPTHGFNGDWREVYEELPRGVEILAEYHPRELGRLIRERIGEVKALWVSRPHNIETLKAAIPELSSFILPVLYDVEGIFSLRELRKLELQTSALIPENEWNDVVSTEIQLAQGAREIVVVSEEEAAEFTQRGLHEVSVLSHAAVLSTIESPFEARRGIVSIAPFTDVETPNGDAVCWFIGKVLPQLDAIYAGGLPRVSILGEVGGAGVTLPETEEVAFPGYVESLEKELAMYRVFVAPMRFGSGISLKTIAAAACGVPIVCTSLVANQLGWKHEREVLVADTATEFAMAVWRLHESKALWEQLSGTARLRVQASFSPESFSRKIEQLLSKLIPLRR